MLVLSLLLLLLAFFFSTYLFFGLLAILAFGYFLIRNDPERYKKRCKTYLTNVFIVFLSFFVAVVLIDIYLHLAQPPFLEMKLSIVGDINDFTSRGYLDEKSFQKPPGSFRILGLGDSFALYGIEKKKNYHNFLQSMLQKETRTPIDVVNAGMAGTGPGYYYLILKKYGDRWKPDLVLMGFFEGNDFEEMDFSIVHRGVFISEPRDPVKRWWAYLRFRGLWLYRYLVRKKTLFLDTYWKKKEKEAAPAAPEGSFSRESFLRIEKSRMWIFCKDRRRELDALWKKDSGVLLKIKEWCQKRKIPLVVGIFPDEFQVNHKLREEIFRTYHLNPDNIDLDYPNQLIRDYCRKHDIPCIDMLGPIRKHTASGTQYVLRDTHWNDAGNMLAARLFFNYLEEHHLVPKN